MDDVLDNALVLARSTVHLLVDPSPDLTIEARRDDQGVLITVNAPTTDLGRLIGREGTAAQALRVLLRAYGLRHGTMCSLKLTHHTQKDTNPV